MMDNTKCKVQCQHDSSPAWSQDQDISGKNSIDNCIPPRMELNNRYGNTEYEQKESRISLVVLGLICSEFLSMDFVSKEQDRTHMENVNAVMLLFFRAWKILGNSEINNAYTLFQ